MSETYPGATPTTTGPRSDNRARIIESAAQLLQTHGPAAVTTRGVADAAGVQAPTIYRLFGDKDGLLEAVAEHVMASYVAAKADVVAAASADNIDPLDDLRAGWTAQIDFGVGNPDLFRLLSDPARALRSNAVASGKRVLEARIHRIAAAGRLRVSEPRAVGMIQSAGVGTVGAILATPEDQRDAGLAEAMYTAVLAQILTDAPATDDTGSTATLVATRAIAPELAALTDTERHLLVEWLDRALSAE